MGKMTHSMGRLTHTMAEIDLYYTNVAHSIGQILAIVWVNFTHTMGGDHFASPILWVDGNPFDP